MLDKKIDKDNSVIVIEAGGKKKSWNHYTGIDVIPTMGHFKDLPRDEIGIDLKNYSGSFFVTKSGQRVSKDLLSKCKNKDVYIATDIDREGDGIGFFVYEHIKDIARNVYRVSVNKITQSHTVEGLNKRSNFADVDINRFNTFLARRLADRMVGYLLSPIASKNLDGNFSVGRVQTIGVKIIKVREDEIANFTVEKFWNIKAKYIYNENVFEFLYNNGKDNNRFASLASAREAVEAIKRHGLVGSVESISHKDKIESAPPPYITSSLQQDAGTKLSIDAKKTMEIAQKLYESGTITYHRTDAFDIDADFIEEIRKFIDENINGDLLPASANIHKSKKSQAEAHEAIRPTDIYFNGDGLDEESKKLYLLIRTRTIASQMKPAKFDLVEVIVDIAGHKFFNKSKTVISKGFLEYYKKDKKEALLPIMKEGDDIAFDDIVSVEGKTTPPSRYTEPTLIAELERREIGRPSTYASIVSKIQDAGYVTLRKEGRSKNKVFFCEEKGHILISFATGDERLSWVCDYDMTKDMENAIDDILEGKIIYTDFLKDIHKKMGMIEWINPRQAYKPLDDISCPICGGDIYDTGKNFVCKEYKWNKQKGYSEGCQFIIWKSRKTYKKDIDLADFKNLCEGGILEGSDGAQLNIDSELVELTSKGEINKENKSFVTKVKNYTDVACPLCAGKVFQTDKQFVCSGNQDYFKKDKWHRKGCKFKISRNSKYFETVLDEVMLEELCDGKVVKSENGKNMILDTDNDFFIVDKDYEKKEKKEVELIGVKCPKCKTGDMYQTEKVYKCNKGTSRLVNKKWINEGCQFMVMKYQNYFDYDITIDDFKALSKGKKIKGGNGQEMEMDPVGKYSIK